MRKRQLYLVIIALFAGAALAVPASAALKQASTHAFVADYHICASGSDGCSDWRVDLSFKMFYNGTGGNGWAWGKPGPPGTSARGSISCPYFESSQFFRLDFGDCGFRHSPAPAGHYACACTDFSVWVPNSAGIWVLHAQRFFRFHLYPNGHGELISGHIPLPPGLG